MTCQVAIKNVGSVGVRVKVDHADVAESFCFSNGSRGGPGNGMVATERDRNDSAAGNFAHSCLDVGQADIGLTVGAIGITKIDDFEIVKNLNAQIHVIAAWFVSLRANRSWAKARAGTVGRRIVVGRANNGDVRLPLIELRRIRQKRPLTKGGKSAEYVAKIELFLHTGGEFALWFGHSRTLPSIGGSTEASEISAWR